jgi:hypothetical protein
VNPYYYYYYIANRWGPQGENEKVLDFPKHKILFEMMHHSTMLYYGEGFEVSFMQILDDLLA